MKSSNQSFCAKGTRRKLAKFIEELQGNSSLWQNLEQHHKVGQILELKESPQLESLVTSIFKSNR